MKPYSLRSFVLSLLFAMSLKKELVILLGIGIVSAVIFGPWWWQPTRAAERKIAPHPSLKPQRFLRQIVRASLPLGKGVILDPFSGSGSTLAAASANSYSSIGVERDDEYYQLCCKSFEGLKSLPSHPSR